MIDEKEETIEVEGVVLTDADLEHSGVLISICCVCGRVYGFRNSEGARGGFSHGYCSEECMWVS